MFAVLADSTFQFSIGAVLGLGAVAVGYGMLRSNVLTLKADLFSLEQSSRTEAKELSDRVRYLERKEDMRKGAERVKYEYPPRDFTNTPHSKHSK